MTMDSETEVATDPPTAISPDTCEDNGPDKNIKATYGIMFDRLSHTEAHFKHQQRGEADLTVAEKLQILTESFQKSPANFLNRFGNYMNISDLNCFERFKDDYEVDYRLKELREFIEHKESIVKNRRYEAMKRLTRFNDYFTDEEMKHRDPLLYEQMVGRYMTGDDIQQQIDKTDLRLSSVLMKHIEMKQDNIVYEIQKEIQDDTKEEEESSDESDDEISAKDTDQEQLSSEEISRLREEFLRTMQERFLMGQDKAFDYSTVDYNTDYDPTTQTDRDLEELYFSSQADDTN